MPTLYESIKCPCINQFIVVNVQRRRMATPPKSPRTEQDYVLSFKRLDVVADAFRTLCQWGTLAFIAFMFYRIAEVLAGKSTYAYGNFQFLANVTVSRSIISLLTASGWVYGLGQRSLRRKHIERTVPAKTALEKQLDSRRTSSNLTPKGTTPRGRGD